jgi:hypothetical protein
MQIRAEFRQPQFLRSDQPVESIGKPILGAIEDRAENFYAKMPKPGPPQAESVVTAARGPRIASKFLRQTSNQTASRDVGASGGLAERTAAKIDE